MKRQTKIFLFFCLLSAVFCLLASATPFFAEQKKVRIGYFPNVTHAQALIMRANHALEEKIGDAAVVEWKAFNAGPSAIEAIFAGRLDISYVGPSPAVNGYVRSSGAALRVIAGSAAGGAALVVREDAGIEKVEDFHGKKIASPQLGNTQDVSLRAWLLKNNLKLKDVGGDVRVIPLANPDQQTLFLKKEIDGAWTVEPWVSLLVQKAGARVFLEESSLWKEGKYATTTVVARQKFLSEHPELVKEFLEAHAAATRWINENPNAAKRTIQKALEKETGKALPEAVLEEAFKKIRFSTESLQDSIRAQAQAAYRAGFLKKDPQLEGLFDLRFLEEGDKVTQNP